MRSYQGHSEHFPKLTKHWNIKQISAELEGLWSHGLFSQTVGLSQKTGRRLSASLIAQWIENLPAVLETWVWSLVWEDPLEKGTAAHSSVLAWRIPWSIHIQSMGWQRVGHNSETFTSQHLETNQNISLKPQWWIPVASTWARCPGTNKNFTWSDSGGGGGSKKTLGKAAFPV